MPSQTLASYKNGMHRLIDGPDWDEVRDATDSDDVTIGGLLYTEGLKWASTTWIVARTFLTFQIPSIPSNNIITSASLKFYTLLYTSPARVIAGTRSDTENNITVGDYNQVNFNTAYSDVVDGSNPNFTLNSGVGKTGRNKSAQGSIFTSFMFFVLVLWVKSYMFVKANGELRLLSSITFSIETTSCGVAPVTLSTNCIFLF